MDNNDRNKELREAIDFLAENSEDDETSYRRQTLDLSNMVEELTVILEEIESAENTKFVKQLMDKAVGIVARAFAIVSEFKLQMMQENVQKLAPSGTAKSAEKKRSLKKKKEKEKSLSV